jgi:hypothetical protein
MRVAARPARRRGRRSGRSGRSGVARRMGDAHAALWLGRRLWRPLTAELLGSRAGRRRRRRRR